MRFLTIGLVLFLAACGALAQTGTEGSILGVVKDSSGAAVPKASVAVTNVETGLTSNLTSDDGGFFQVFALPRGSYSVVVSAGLPNTGLATPTTGKILAAGDARQLQFGLKFVF